MYYVEYKLIKIIKIILLKLKYIKKFVIFLSKFFTSNLRTSKFQDLGPYASNTPFLGCIKIEKMRFFQLKTFQLPLKMSEMTDFFIKCLFHLDT